MIALVYRTDDDVSLVGELAAHVARYSGKRVVIVDGPGRADDPRLFAAGHALPDLAALLRDPDHVDAVRGDMCTLDGRVPPGASTEAVAAAFGRLRLAFDHVLVCVRADQCAAAARVLGRLTAILAITSSSEMGRAWVASDALRGTSQTPTTMIVTDAPARPTRGDLRRLAARAGGASIFSAAQLSALARTLTRTRVGVALGCGGARGFAHIGVLERLVQRGVPIDVLAGTSAGAGIASLWALGLSPDWIAERFAELATHAVRPGLPTRSLLSGRALLRHFDRSVDGLGFDDVLLPLGVVAADLDTGAEVTLTQGSLTRSVLASCAIPGLYPAVELDGRMLVDGGLLQPVPSRTAAALGADLVLAVDLSRQEARPRRWGSSIMDTVLRAADVLQGHLAARTALAVPNAIRITPRGKRVGVVGYARAASYRALGRDAVDAAWPELVAQMPWLEPSAERSVPRSIAAIRPARSSAA